MCISVDVHTFGFSFSFFGLCPISIRHHSGFEMIRSAYWEGAQ